MRPGNRVLVWIALAGLAWAAPTLVAKQPADIESMVRYLSAEELEGRLTGSDGARTAAVYLARQLERIGARPLPGQAGYDIPFRFTAGSKDLGSSLALKKGDDESSPRRFRGTDTVRALSFSDDGTIEGSVVFAGYGLVIPDGEEQGYDSYATLDVKDKIVLVLRYFPEDTEGELRQSLARYAGLRYKAMLARDRGAKALLVVTGPRSPNAGETIAMMFDANLSGSGIVAASIASEPGEALLAAAGDKGLEALQAELDSGNPHVAGFEIPDLTAALEVKIEREQRTGQNVVGFFPGSESSVPGAAPAIVIGAHFDHLGRGGHGNSLARQDEVNEVHPGADDNASGVAAVLAAGAELAGVERRHPIVLAFWSGEELGLLGSAAFVKADLVPPATIVGYVNLDMVGRVRENKLNLQGVGSSSAWPALIERANVAVGFDVHTQEDPYLPMDSTTFYQAGVPILSLFSGSHEDYHRPTDQAESVNYEDLGRVARLTALLVRRLDGAAERPAYVKVERTLQAGASAAGRRAFTGTIPDYTTEVEGLRLSGVVGGGPADKAGLAEGDVIVEFAGKRIANIYDYTYALDAVKVDEPVEVVFERDGERQEITIVPTARP